MRRTSVRGEQKAKVKACYPNRYLKPAGFKLQVLEDVILVETLSAWTEGDVEDEIREAV